MRKLVFTAAIAVIVGAASTVRVQGTPLFEGTRAADFLQQCTRMKEQLDTARSQLAEAQRLFESMSGTRGFGDVLRNHQLRQYLPDDLKTVYDTVNGGGYSGISGSIDDILREEQLFGSVTEMARASGERSRRTMVTDKAVGLLASERAQQRHDPTAGP